MQTTTTARHSSRSFASRKAWRSEGSDGPSSELRPKALGWLSIGLGATAVALPSMTARLLGAPVTRQSEKTLRAVGLRELGVGAGLLSGKRSPAALTWLRVIGDAMDLSLLLGALGARRSKRDRLLRSVGVIAGITLVDVAAAVMQTRQERATLA